MPELPPIEVKGRVLYVAPDGNRKANGLTPETALPPQKAEELSQPGDVIYFTTGEYDYPEGSRALTIEHSGEPGKPVVYAPAPGARVTLRNSGGWEVIKVVGARHIEIRGFRIVGNAHGISMEEAVREMDNIGKSRTCGNGIAIDKNPKTQAPSAHITVRGCHVSHLPGGGIYMSHSDYITFESNVVHHCAYWSPFANSGLSMYQPTAVDDDTTRYKIIVRNNVCFANYQNIPFIFSNKKEPAKRKVTDGNGIILDDFQCTQGWGGGVGKPYAGRTLVANNIVFGNGGSGIHTFKSLNIDIFHNHSADNNRHPSLHEGQIFSNTSWNVRILNNVMIGQPGKPVTTSFANKNLVQRNNLYFALDGSVPKFEGPKADNLLAAPGLELAGWEQGIGTFSATADSPLRGAAIPLEESLPDHFGKARDQAQPDIGPFVLGGGVAIHGSELPIPISTVITAPAAPPAAPAATGGNETLTLEACGHGPSQKTTKVATVAGPEEGATAIQVTIPADTEGRKYRVNAKGKIAGAIAADRPVTLTFTARSPGGNKVLVMIHNGANPDRVKLITEIKLTPEWKTHTLKGNKAEAFAAGEASADFMMGEASGVIEIGKVTITR